MVGQCFTLLKKYLFTNFRIHELYLYCICNVACSKIFLLIIFEKILDTFISVFPLLLVQNFVFYELKTLVDVCQLSEHRPHMFGHQANNICSGRHFHVILHILFIMDSLLYFAVFPFYSCIVILFLDLLIFYFNGITLSKRIDVVSENETA